MTKTAGRFIMSNESIVALVALINSLATLLLLCGDSIPYDDISLGVEFVKGCNNFFLKLLICSNSFVLSLDHIHSLLFPWQVLEPKYFTNTFLDIFRMHFLKHILY